MKEYILVNLSGICKLVEKTKWPKKEDFMYQIIDDTGRPDWSLDKVKYERQKLEAFEGGAMVVDIPLDLALFSQEFFDQFPSDPYPIDPSIWEVVEQWQYKALSDTWHNWESNIEPDIDEMNKEGFETRLTATIKPKERPDYVSKDIKKVSEVDLKTALKEVKKHNQEIRDSFKNPDMSFRAGDKPKENSAHERDWKEDFGHENGNYQNKCIECGLMFMGHKRRVQCKKCATPDWVQLAKKRPPEDTKNNQAWHGAWLDGEMVGYAKCMVDKVLPFKQLSAYPEPEPTIATDRTSGYDEKCYHECPFCNSRCNCFNTPCSCCENAHVALMEPTRKLDEFISWMQSELCERRDYSASKVFEMCIERAKLIQL